VQTVETTPDPFRRRSNHAEFQERILIVDYARILTIGQGGS
jgi:hypothetical protein